MSPRAALLCSLAAIAGVMTPVAASAPGVAFAPTGHPMILTRTVWRSLADGRQIRVARSFRIEIERSAAGFTVRGRQIAVEVDAPQQVALIADVERGRDESGLFPLHLDSSGRIVEPAAAPAAAGGTHSDLVAAARHIIAAHPVPHHPEGMAFIEALASSGAANRWPADLFRAAPGEDVTSRPIALPDGSSGDVRVAVRTADALPCGVPMQVDREVVTRLGATSRINRERWTFARVMP